MPVKGSIKDITKIGVKKREVKDPPPDEFRGTIRDLIIYGLPRSVIREGFIKGAS